MINCANCEHLLIMGGKPHAFAGCAMTCKTVPHTWDEVTRELTFRRVPLDCPLPDTNKRKRAAPRRTWIAIKVK